jgi:hypothetical protein
MISVCPRNSYKGVNSLNKVSIKIHASRELIIVVVEARF